MQKIKPSDPRSWLPSNALTEQAEERRVGVEIEMAGLTPGKICQVVQAQWGGRVEEKTPMVWFVRDTRVGDFTIELDAQYLQKLAATQTLNQSEPLAEMAMEFITSAAEQVVPWELVTPPLPFSQLSSLYTVIEGFHKAGGKGTRHAIHYAFGVHLNQELPALDASTITNYLRAYFCLYDWILDNEKTDLTRRLSTFIKHFDKNYVAKVVDPDYQPDLAQLINDYLQYNPSRNRSLDMLPLFAYLDAERVKQVVNDSLVSARPTLHYRLPNCDIDNPRWNIDKPWQLWLAVEALVADKPRLERYCREYLLELSRMTHILEDRWLKRLNVLMAAEEIA